MKINSKLKLGALIISGTLSMQGAFATERLIIKYKVTPSQAQALQTHNLTTQEIRLQQMKPLSMSQVDALSAKAGVKVTEVNQIGTGAHVLEIDKPLNKDELQQVITNLKSDPSVEYVTEDKLVKPLLNTQGMVNPNKQWDMYGQYPLNPSWFGNYFTGAWGLLTSHTVTPGQGIIVAVVDSGYTPHPNFLSNLQPLSPGSSSYGYQFISDCRKAGSCPVSTLNAQASLNPQPNALDLGDYLTQADINNAGDNYFRGCAVQNVSDWHGTHVTGTVIAQGYDSDNDSGISGGAYGATVVPVRVLGKCGGYISDIQNGLIWAAGGRVSDLVPINSNPAQVINMSFGFDTPVACGADLQDAINIAASFGTFLVAAAGNSTANVANFPPANCQNVISVSASGPTQALTPYSNYGATTITAAGGDSTIKGTSSEIYSTVWNSPQQYNSSSGGGYAYYEGTSMATPHVVAAIADILSFNKSLSYTQIVNILQRTATPFTGSNNCNSGGCVTGGQLNTEAAINYLINQFESQALTSIPSSITIPANTFLSQSVTFFNKNSGSIQISSINLSSALASISIDPTLTTCVNGTILTQDQNCNVQIVASISTTAQTGVLTVTTSTGVIASSVTITQQGASPAPTPSSGGGGGGCSSITDGNDMSLMLALLLASVVYIYQRRASYRLKQVNS